MAPTAPTAAGALADQTFNDDTGTRTVATAQDFTGAGLTYSLTTAPTGVTINSTTGVVSVDTNAMAVQADRPIVVRADNTGGFAQSAFSLTISAAVAPSGDITFGALTRVGEGAAPISASNGNYGAFTVFNGSISPNAALTPGTYDVAGTSVVVTGNTRTISSEAQFQTAVAGANRLANGSTLAMRDIGRVYALRQYDNVFTAWWGQLPTITLTSADTTRARLDRLQLGRVATNGFTIDNLKFELSTPYPDVGDFWAQYGVNGDRFILTEGGQSATNLAIRNCHFDGGLEPWIEGGRLTTSTTPISTVGLGDGFIFEDNLVEKTSYGLELSAGVSNAIVRRNTFQKLHADTIMIQNGTTKWSENIVFRDNLVRWWAGYSGDLHSDFFHFQPRGGATSGFRNIDIFGNICLFGTELLPVAGPEPVGAGEGPQIVNLTAATTINTAAHHANELRVRTNANITMPPAASVPGTVFSFRAQDGFGAQIVLASGDTWDAGAAPIVGTGGRPYATFQSDGTNVWKQVKGGLRAHHMQRYASFTLGALELGGRVAFLDATAGNIDVSLPDTGKYYLIRDDRLTTRTVRIVAGTKTLLHHGTSVPFVNLPPGYGGVVENTGGNTWVFSEEPHDLQGVFSNAAAAGATDRFQNIRVHGNILEVSSTHGMQIEAPVQGEVFNNVFIRNLRNQDLNGDGVIGVYEGNSSLPTATVNISGAQHTGSNNVIVGNLNVDTNNLLPGAKVFSNIVGNCTNMATAYDFTRTHLTGNSYADFAMDTREDALAALSTRAGSPAAGAFAGATPYYDFVNQQVRASDLPAPTIASTTPLHQATEISRTGTTVKFIFTGPVVAGASGTVSVRTGGSVVENFDVVTGVGSNGGTLTFTNGEVTIALGSDLALSTQYAIQITAGAFVHKNYGTAFAGITNDTTLFFTTQQGTVAYGNAVAGGDSPVQSVDYRFPSTHFTTLHGAQWVRNNGTPGEENRVSIDARPTFGPNMSTATRNALSTPGNFVAMYDWVRPASGTIRLQSSSWGNADYNTGNNQFTAPSGAVFSGNLDVSALYGAPTGTVYRTFMEYTVSAAGQWFVFGTLVATPVRRAAIFNRSSFNTGNAAMQSQIATLPL